MKEYLVETSDVLDASVQSKEQFKDVALKLSIDIFSIHERNEHDDKRKFQEMVAYFKDRKGVWDEDTKKASQMALKMYMMGMLATNVYPRVMDEFPSCKVRDFNINFEFVRDGEVSVTVGINKKVSKKKAKTLRMLIDVHLKYMFKELAETPFIDGFTAQAQTKTDARKLYEEISKMDEAEIDAETEKALNRLEWDKTISGEA